MPDAEDFRDPSPEPPPFAVPHPAEGSVAPSNPPPPLATEIIALTADDVILEALPVPSAPPHPGFWWAVLWCLGVLVVTQLVPGMVAAFALLAQGMSVAQLQNTQALMQSPQYAQALMWAMVLAEVLSIAMAWLVIRLIVGREWPRILALRPPSAAHLALTLMGLFGLMLVANGVDEVAKKVLPSLIDLEQVVTIFGKWPLPVGILLIGLGPGIAGELWCRGFFGRGLVGRHGVVIGVLLTSLLFGLIHVEPRQVVYATVMGVLLHLSYLASRSLLVPMILHTANNSLGILVMHIPAFQAPDATLDLPLYVYGAAVLLVAAVGWAGYRSRAVLVDCPDSGAWLWRPEFPGVELPPPQSATRVVQRGPGGLTWLVAIASFVLFVAALIPAILRIVSR